MNDPKAGTYSDEKIAKDAEDFFSTERQRTLTFRNEIKLEGNKEEWIKMLNGILTLNYIARPTTQEIMDHHLFRDFADVDDRVGTVNTSGKPGDRSYNSYLGFDHMVNYFVETGNHTTEFVFICCDIYNRSIFVVDEGNNTGESSYINHAAASIYLAASLLNNDINIDTFLGKFGLSKFSMFVVKSAARNILRGLGNILYDNRLFKCTDSWSKRVVSFDWFRLCDVYMRIDVNEWANSNYDNSLDIYDLTMFDDFFRHTYYYKYYTNPQKYEGNHISYLYETESRTCTENSQERVGELNDEINAVYSAQTQVSLDSKEETSA
jgi:hypothetical protein